MYVQNEDPHTQVLDIYSILLSHKCHKQFVFKVGFGIKNLHHPQSLPTTPSPLTFTPSQQSFLFIIFLLLLLILPISSSSPSFTLTHAYCLHLFMKENFPVFSFHLSSASTNPLCPDVPLRQEV